MIPVDSEHATARRVLPLVRSPRQGRSGGDHRAAHREKLEAIQWCGGVYSSEWGFSKLLHWLRHNPDKRTSGSSRPSNIATWLHIPYCEVLQPLQYPDEGEFIGGYEGRISIFRFDFCHYYEANLKDYAGVSRRCEIF